MSESYLLLDGASYVTAPDSSGLPWNESGVLLFDGALDNWNNGTQALIAQWGTGGNAYALQQVASNFTQLAINTGPAQEAQHNVSNFAAGSRHLIKAEYTFDNGDTPTPKSKVAFSEWIDDAWSLLSEKTYTQTLQPRPTTTASVGIGAYHTGANAMAGKVYRAQVWQGSIGPSSNLLLDCNPAAYRAGSFWHGGGGHKLTLNGNAQIVNPQRTRPKAMGVGLGLRAFG